MGAEERGDLTAILHEALERLVQDHPRPAQVATLRFFGGSSVPEAAATLEVPHATIEIDSHFARTWLRGQVGGTPG